MSDNGPQFSADVFSTFSNDYGFTHITSSPRFPQFNGEAERAVKTIKVLLKKCDDRNEDHYLALMAYRVTPLECGYSPAELLTSCMLQTNVPTFYNQLQPKVPNLSSLQEKEQKIRGRQKHNFDSSHNAQSLIPLNSGDDVWLPKEETTAKIQSSAGFRSYNVTTSNENTIRRNRKHLATLPTQNDSNENQRTSGRIVKPPIRFSDEQYP